MQCSRCKFENMPGLTTCMRCGSILTAPQGLVSVDPPRMARWKGPFRRLARGLRGSRVFSPLQNVRVPGWLVLFSNMALFGIILSIVPGLAHWIQKRFKSIRWWVAGWAVLLLLTLFLFGGFPGYLLFGLTLAVHVWIALHSSFLKGNNDLSMRIVVFLLALILYYFLYTRVGGLIFSSVQPGHSVVSVPAQQVELGDYLLGRRSPVGDPNHPRGSFVYVNLREVGRRRWNPFFERDYYSYVQIIGLGGETVELRENTFFVNQEPLDTNRFPVPRWLRGRTLLVNVPHRSYFISAEYRGARYNDQLAIQACVISADRVMARAFLRWWPLWRRGFIRNDE